MVGKKKRQEAPKCVWEDNVDNVDDDDDDDEKWGTLEENAIVFLFSLIFLRFHLLRDMRFHHECDHLPEG